MSSKTSRTSIACSAAFLAACIIFPAVATTQDAAFKPVLVTEHGFENGNRHNWVSRGGIGMISLTSETAHTGSSSLKISDRFQDWNMMRVELTPALQRSARYRIELWMRVAKGELGGAANLTVLTRYPDKDVETSLSGDVPINDSQWTKLEGEWVFDPVAIGAHLYPYFKANPAAPYLVDDLKATKIAAPAGARLPATSLHAGTGERRFAILGDSTALGRGVQKETFEAVAGVIRSLTPRPELLVHLGDHFWGNSSDEQDLRAQWREWGETAKALGDLPTLHLAGNHTCFDAMSARVFSEMVRPLLPRNTEVAADGLQFVWRDGDLVFVAANAVFRGGTEGRVDWRFVDEALRRHADARFKFVASHYPVFPVNGFRPPCWRVSAEDAGPLWQTLVKHTVTAYLCAHIIAFDVQIHDGIPQICSGGAGYSLLYPPQTEYHHAVQLAVDSRRLEWQAIDTADNVRERAAWPLHCPARDEWPVVEAKGQAIAELRDSGADVLLMHFDGEGAAISPEEQTLLTGWTDSSAPPAVWIGLDGGRLQVRISVQRGEPTIYWRGPIMSGAFSFDIALHRGLGPGGVLYRNAESKPWTSLPTDSSRGFADISWPKRWSIGMGHAAYDRESGGGGRLVERSEPFLGSSL